jgi:hypothetical protein
LKNVVDLAEGRQYQPEMLHCYLLLFILMVTVLHSGCGKTNSDPIVKDRSIGQAEEVAFSQSSPVIECYDFVEGDDEYRKAGSPESFY